MVSTWISVRMATIMAMASMASMVNMAMVRSMVTAMAMVMERIIKSSFGNYNL